MDFDEEEDLFSDAECVVLARPVLNSITPILHWLIREKWDHPEVVQFVEQGMLEQVSDLQFFFTKARPPSDPNVHKAWLASCDFAHEGHALLLDVVLAMSARESTGSLPCRTMPKATKHRKPKPPTKALDISQGADDKLRMLIASQAVALSWSWAPFGGLAVGLPPATEVHARRQQAATKRIAVFEPRTVRACIVTWIKWKDWCAKLNIIAYEVEPSATWCVEDFIDSFTSGTSMARSTVDKLLWLKTHAGAPLPLTAVRWPRRGRQTERMQPEEQAVVIEIGMFETIELEISRLTIADDWQATVMAAAWASASACIRFRHLQRSAPVRLLKDWVVMAA